MNRVTIEVEVEVGDNVDPNTICDEVADDLVEILSAAGISASIIPIAYNDIPYGGGVI